MVEAVAAEPRNGLREQVKQALIEIQSLRESRHEHWGLILTLQALVSELRKDTDKLAEEADEAKERDQELELRDREFMQNWRLTLAVGAAALMGLVMLIVAIATRLI